MMIFITVFSILFCLRIVNVTSEETGRYICRATDGVSEATDFVMLLVMVPPTIYMNHPSTYR